MQDPIIKIEEIKNCLLEVIKKNNITNLNVDINSILVCYSIDFCNIMKKLYPGATLMINKNFKNCAILIDGKIYSSRGIENRTQFFVVEKEEFNYIEKYFLRMSDNTYYDWLNEIKNHKDENYTLQKKIN